MNKPNLPELNFKTAFKATMGFYAAQLVMSIIVLLFLLGGCSAFGALIYWVNKPV